MGKSEYCMMLGVEVSLDRDENGKITLPNGEKVSFLIPFEDESRLCYQNTYDGGGLLGICLSKFSTKSSINTGYEYRELGLEKISKGLSEKKVRVAKMLNKYGFDFKPKDITLYEILGYWT